MTNLLTVLPDLDQKPHTHILPSLEKAQVSAADLLTLDTLDVAKRAQIPPGEVRKLEGALLDELHGGDARLSSLTSGSDLVQHWATVSTLDDELDRALGGGIAAGCLTEIVGERSVTLVHPTSYRAF